jgi:phosphoribosylaminoimidazole-succinocarboxamide synthase
MMNGMQTAAQSIVDIPGIKKLRSGKVREVFDLGETLLFVATDRISAFDVILPDPIPKKGAVLNQLSAFWFNKFGKIDNHFITTDFNVFPKQLRPFRQQLEGRSMIVKRTKPLEVECVVRGYLAGSGWKEYQQSQSVCGIKLPSGLKQASKLPEPIFTPATKATVGHDENISYAAAVELVGAGVAAAARELCLAAYDRGAKWAEERGIIIADTKFELGWVDGELVICDEVLTPDSSRFWPADAWRPGAAPPSLDKQPVRDWLEGTGWDKAPPPPPLPAGVVAATSARYVEAYERLSGRPFAEWPQP